MKLPAAVAGSICSRIDELKRFAPPLEAGIEPFSRDRDLQGAVYTVNMVGTTRAIAIVKAILLRLKWG